MRGLQLVPYNTKIDFVGLRFVAFGITAFIIIATALSIYFKGFNLGIDFKGGMLIEVRTHQKADLASLRTTLNALQIGDVKLQDFGNSNDVLIRMEKQHGGAKAQEEAIGRVKKALGNSVDYRRIETVGGKVSEDLIQNGIWAMLFAMVGMLIYVWIRFEWQYGLCGILSLVHDSIAVIGFYSLSGFELKETAFAALLTTIGYSINDTVVIYDRLRENLRKYKTTPFPEVLNLSANETLSRTILTSTTTLLALVALYFFGGAEIENFSLPIIVGIVVGTFSSIFVSSTLLLYFDLRKKKDDEPIASGPITA
jgi:preprotein translocase subunit SecF